MELTLQPVRVKTVNEATTRHRHTPVYNRLGDRANYADTGPINPLKRREKTMIAFREIPNTNIVEFTIDGKISKEGFDDIIARFEGAIRKHGTVRVLEEIRAFGCMPVAKFWDDIKFGFKNMKNFSRAAVVADQKWIEVLTKMASPFVSADVRYFTESEIDQARQWLCADQVA